MSDQINEGALERSVDKKADNFFKKYRDQMESMEKSPLAAVRTPSSYDYYALGTQLDAWENYVEMCEEDGTVNALGKLPNIALDVITVGYGSSPINVMASVQPIEEEMGSVYYKKLIANTTRGAQTAGDEIFNPTAGGQNPLNGYSSDTLQETVATTVDAQLSYSGNLANAPLRREKVFVTVDLGGGTVLNAKDDGAGYLIGYNLQGTIDYTTGAFVLEFSNNPGAGHDIIITSGSNFEAATDIPKVSFKLTTKQVQARVWALKDTIGMEQSYALKRRFGLTADDEMTKDLVASINSELSAEAIRKLAVAAKGNVNYSKSAPANVSDYDHRMGFKFKLADAEANLLGNAGRGTINVYIAGLNACSIISTLPGFKKVSDGNDIGPHIFGTLDGITVIRVQNAQILDPDALIGIYKGQSPFEGPLVWAPYMPLVTTSAMPTGANPLTTQKAAAVWGGLDLLVDNFVTKVTLTA